MEQPAGQRPYASPSAGGVATERQPPRSNGASPRTIRRWPTPAGRKAQRRSDHLSPSRLTDTNAGLPKQWHRYRRERREVTASDHLERRLPGSVSAVGYWPTQCFPPEPPGRSRAKRSNTASGVWCVLAEYKSSGGRDLHDCPLTTHPKQALNKHKGSCSERMSPIIRSRKYDSP